MILYLLILAWLLIGYYSFKFWWSKDFTFIKDDIYFGMLVSFLGLLGWLFGYFEHSRGRYTIFGRAK